MDKENNNEMNLDPFWFTLGAKKRTGTQVCLSQVNFCDPHERVLFNPVLIKVA